MAHLLAPSLFGVGAHGAGKCVPGAPGPGREAGEPDAEPAGGDVGLGSQPPRHKDKLPNHSTNACWHGNAVVRGTTGVRPALLDCLQHRWCCHAGWVQLPTAEGVPRAGGGAPGRRECFPALGATGAGCTGCGATARVDEGAQRAPHPNGLSVVRGGLGRGSGPLDANEGHRVVQRTLVKPIGHSQESGSGAGGGDYETPVAGVGLGRARLLWSLK